MSSFSVIFFKTYLMYHCFISSKINGNIRINYDDDYYGVSYNNVFGIITLFRNIEFSKFLYFLNGNLLNTYTFNKNRKQKHLLGFIYNKYYLILNNK